MPPVVYCNGRFLPADGPVLSATDRGFLLGDGLYETIRVAAKRPLAIDAHYRRLRRNLQELAIPFEPDPDVLDGAMAELLARNGLSDARLRLSVSAGPTGGPPTVLISAVPYEPPPETVYSAGVAVVSSAIPHPRMAVKSLSHLAYVLVDRAARAAGAFEGLFLEDGHWIEGSRTNLIGRQGQRLLIPDSPWALPGVTLANVVAAAQDLGWPIQRGPLGPADLASLDGLYLTNALIEVVPVNQVDGQPIASAGNVARQLREAYRRIVGLPPLGPV